MKRDSVDSVVSQRGQEAQQVLANAAYVQAIEQMKLDVIEAWKACPIRDTDGQRLYLQIAKLADKFDKMLHDYVEAGRFADLKASVDDVRDENGVRKVIRKVI